MSLDVADFKGIRAGQHYGEGQGRPGAIGVFSLIALNFGTNAKV